MSGPARGARWALEPVLGRGRSFPRFLGRPVPPALLRELYDWACLGPTAMNSQPLRIRFLASPDQRAALAACVHEGNRDKVLSAPVCAVLGMDLDFPDTLERLFPHKAGAAEGYRGRPGLVETAALRNSSLQAGYLIMAARMLGLDCGPMSGFVAEQVDALVWPGTSVRTNLLCNLGYGDRSALFPRGPRLEFDQACEIL